jgi:hypothetical protein
MFEQSKTVHALDRATTVISLSNLLFTLTRVEAGSNTSTVTLQVVRGEEMGLKKAAP